jgi:predicted transposase/invertase (TIGR01784 family)
MAIGMARGMKTGMAKGIETGMAKGIETGMTRGIEKKSFEVARSMLADGLPIEAVKKYTGLGEQEIRALQ